MDARDTIRKLLRLAADDAAAQGEVDNAVRLAKKLMKEHQLSEWEFDDVSEEADVTERVQTASCTEETSHSLATNLSAWEKTLAAVVAKFVGAGIGCYYNATPVLARDHNGIAKRDEKGKTQRRARVVFYGLEEDARYAQEVYEDLSLAIAAMGRLKFGGAFRGDGRSYCMGCVAGLREKLWQPLKHVESDSTALVVRHQQLERAKRRRLVAFKAQQGYRFRSAGRSAGVSCYDAYREGVSDGRRMDVSGRRTKLSGSRASIADGR